ncbi:extracellular matrix A-like [Paramuricea clavata]|uniref:Extracellular matrix A-like n=1 Tax=Paramuricea clavata TaxID=317549 RepID=A0A7D9DHF2_PARCT|nr:extracellular matrix A-like [Paramuricea clavata]
MKVKTMNIVLVYIVILSFQQDQVSGWRRRRRRRSCSPVNCQWGSWSSWSVCSHRCGSAGVQTRTRSIRQSASCGGSSCSGLSSYSRPCNRGACHNGGTPVYGRCYCTPGWTGTCCESDLDECSSSSPPCQHICHNVFGSYTCRCHDCYTKLGGNCELRQCKIGGKCFQYGHVNPTNQCQDCQTYRKTIWTNNNALSCSDNNLCTRNDKCVDGTCKGTPFTCLGCQRCNGDRCMIKPGFCVIDGICYSHRNLRPGKPCQECNSNNPTTWTTNNNLVCSDNNVMTRNDRCTNGKCRGEPFTCLTCQDHHNDTCRIKSSYCLINYNNVDTCFTATTEKPENPCQWCLPEASTTTWTNKHDVPCDDGDSCTKSDTCKHGQCEGISFTCNNDCQSCNGSDCGLHIGYGYVADNCTCKIAGRDYNHQQLNPSNECQWCDIYDKTSKPILAWSNRPSVVCNDNNACTKQDLCQNGYCVGTEYSCQASYPQSSCVQTSQCVGDGTCRYIMKNNGTICRAAIDMCDQSERCNGVIGTCPPTAINPIYLQEGQARITVSNFAKTVTFQSSTDKLHLQLSGFSVTCGSLTVRWSLIKAENSCYLGRNNATLSSNTNNHILTGLNLQNTDTYKVVVQASNIREQLGLPVCSNDVTIDTGINDGRLPIY